MGDVQAVEAVTLIPSKNRMEYQRGMGLTEWFVNDRRGLEQGFTLKEPPSRSKGKEGDAWVVLRMAIHGSLKGNINAEENTIDFITTGGASVIKYSHLKVFDATGKDL